MSCPSHYSSFMTWIFGEYRSWRSLCSLIHSHHLDPLRPKYLPQHHYVFSTIHSITANSFSTVLYAAWVTLCSCYYSGFRRSKISKQGIAGKWKRHFNDTIENWNNYEGCKWWKSAKGYGFIQCWIVQYPQYSEKEEPIMVIYSIKWEDFLKQQMLKGLKTVRLDKVYKWVTAVLRRKTHGYCKSYMFLWQN